MYPFLGTSKVAEPRSLHLLSPHVPPKMKKEQEGKNKPTQKPSKEKREEITTGPKVDLKPL